jgi:hypothetical protein
VISPCGCEESVTLRAEVKHLRNVIALNHTRHHQTLVDVAALDRARQERDALRDRVTTICDEACGLQPVQSADDSLTMIEQHMARARAQEWRLEAAAREAVRLLTYTDWCSVSTRAAVLDVLTAALEGE